MIAMLRYNAGNIMSVKMALQRIGYEVIITSDPEILLRADKIIIPGVGEAGSAMNFLKERDLDSLIISLKKPVLGICLGLQLLCRYSEENDTACLGIFDTDVKRLPRTGMVPHMGWDDFESISDNPLLKGIKPSDDVYYVHSYCAGVNSYTTAVCDYLLPFSAAMNRDNFFGVQFHPEKSAETGSIILKNFAGL